MESQSSEHSRTVNYGKSTGTWATIDRQESGEGESLNSVMPSCIVRAATLRIINITDAARDDLAVLASQMMQAQWSAARLISETMSAAVICHPLRQPSMLRKINTPSMYAFSCWYIAPLNNCRGRMTGELLARRIQLRF